MSEDIYKKRVQEQYLKNKKRSKQVLEDIKNKHIIDWEEHNKQWFCDIEDEEDK